MDAKSLTLDELLRASDVVTLHVPLLPATKGLIGGQQLARMKQGAILINAARGGIVDEKALYDAIVDGRVAGAGLDVYAKEPCTDSPLFGLENVVATPHLGASTDEAQEKAGIAVAKSVRLALSGELVPDAVNVQGGQLDESIKPMLPLAERLGAIACSLAGSAVVRVDVEALGEIADHDVRVLELSALKGVFQMLVHDPVSFVNAPVLAEQRGVEVALTTDRTSEHYRSLLRVTLTQTDGTKVTVAGTVAGGRDIGKVVEVDTFDVDVPVSDHMAFFRYHDRPGVVGVVGRVLGEAGVNIGGMQVSRDEGGHALIVLTVDSAVPADRIDAIVAEIGAHSGKAVDLD
jgi:D-3-phosphoglycerate dehydrogenase